MFREFLDKATTGTVFLINVRNSNYDCMFVGTKTDTCEAIFHECDDPSFIESDIIPVALTDTYWERVNERATITLIDYIAPNYNVKNLCTCDFYTVVLVTGCKCGGK